MMSNSAQAAPSPDGFAQARFNMVEGQIRPNRVSDARLLAALATVPREIFVPPALAGVAYVDEALPVGGGRYLSEPLALARLLQEAAAGPGDRALAVGCATGYSAAILGRLAGAVTAVECDEGLAAKARANLNRLGAGNVAVESGPLAHGWPRGAPYDIVLFDGAIVQLPDWVASQLAEGGRLVTIRSQEGRAGAGMLYRKLGGMVSGRALFDATAPFLPGFEPQPAFAL